MSERVLVTGGAGFIGSHLCDELAGRGHEVWILDNFDDYYDPGLKRSNVAGLVSRPEVHLVEGDVRDTVLTGGLFTDVAFDAVIHLAARPGVAASMDNPDISYEMNVRGTLRLLESMGRHDVRRLVLASSSAVYGAGTALPFTEGEAADRPLSHYGASKRSAELLAHTHHRVHDLAVHCLRLFTVYGSRQRPEMAVHRFVRLMTAGRTLPIHGDGDSLRDFVHVDDAVNGIRLSLEHLMERDDSVFEAINIGSGQPVALHEVVSRLGTALGVEATVEIQPAKPWRMEATGASLEKARNLIGYRPRVELSVGLTEFVQWLRNDEHSANGGPPESAVVEATAEPAPPETEAGTDV